MLWFVQPKHQPLHGADCHGAALVPTPLWFTARQLAALHFGCEPGALRVQPATAYQRRWTTVTLWEQIPTEPKRKRKR